MLDVKGEAAELIHSEEGGREGLLRPKSANPVTISPNSKFSRVIDNKQLGDYLLHNLVQGGFLNCSPLKIYKYKILCKLAANILRCQRL